MFVGLPKLAAVVGAALICFTPAAAAAQDTLLVYEGFDCAGADLSALQGQAGATSIGFDALSTWGTPVGSITPPETLDDIARYNTTGLSIGSGATTLKVVGGSMTLTHLPHGSRYYISRALDVAQTGGQTVYGAYLMNYVTRNASTGRVSVDNPAGNDASRYHFGGGFGRWNSTSTIGYLLSVGNTSVTGITGTNAGGPNLTGNELGLGNIAITLFSITNVGGSSGSVLMWQYVLNSAQFDNFKAGGLTETELQGAATGAGATQVLQRATHTLAAPNPYPQWGLSDVLTFWWYDKALTEVIKLDEVRFGTGSLDAVTPLATPPSGYASWATTNSITGDPSDDSNNDGVANGVAYFMNATGLATNPGINSSGQVTWPNGGNILSGQYGTEFVVQTSSDLQKWVDVPSGQLDANTDYAAGPPAVDGSLSYTLTGASPRFVRLKVTPN
jgi:hypothetical protein